MADQTAPVQGTGSQSQAQPVESPEVTAARAKSSTAGFARNRAEATYNQLKKEKGVDSPEAKAAKATLEAAQAEVEKAQAELRAALKLPTKSSTPVAKKAAPSKNRAPKQTVAKKEEAPVNKIPVPESAPRNNAVIERAYILEHRSMETIEFLKTPDPELRKKFKELLDKHKSLPKTLEQYRQQINNGEMLRVLEAPRGEMAIRRDAAYLFHSTAKLEKR